MTPKSLPAMLMDDHQSALLNSRQYDRRPDLNRQEQEALTNDPSGNGYSCYLLLELV